MAGNDLTSCAISGFRYRICLLCSFAVHFTITLVSRLCSVELYDDRWIEKDLEGSTRGLFDVQLGICLYRPTQSTKHTLLRKWTVVGSSITVSGSRRAFHFPPLYLFHITSPLPTFQADDRAGTARVPIRSASPNNKHYYCFPLSPSTFISLSLSLSLSSSDCKGLACRRM
jgi:hypothetical protein